MTQCYDMHESVSTYTNYNHYESTILELSHFKKSGDYGNGTRRYHALTAAKRSPRCRGLYLTPIRFPYPNGLNT